MARLALEMGDMERREAVLQMIINICDNHNISFGLAQIYIILATMALAGGETKKCRIDNSYDNTEINSERY